MKRTHGENKIAIWTETYKPPGSMVMEIAFWKKQFFIFVIFRLYLKIKLNKLSDHFPDDNLEVYCID